VAARGRVLGLAWLWFGQSPASGEAESVLCAWCGVFLRLPLRRDLPLSTGPDPFF